MGTTFDKLAHLLNPLYDPKLQADLKKQQKQQNTALWNSNVLQTAQWNMDNLSTSSSVLTVREAQ